MSARSMERVSPAAPPNNSRTARFLNESAIDRGEREIAPGADVDSDDENEGEMLPPPYTTESLVSRVRFALSEHADSEFTPPVIPDIPPIPPELSRILAVLRNGPEGAAIAAEGQSGTVAIASSSSQDLPNQTLSTDLPPLEAGRVRLRLANLTRGVEERLLDSHRRTADVMASCLHDVAEAVEEEIEQVQTRVNSAALSLNQLESHTRLLHTTARSISISVSHLHATHTRLLRRAAKLSRDCERLHSEREKACAEIAAAEQHRLGLRWLGTPDGHRDRTGSELFSAAVSAAGELVLSWVVATVKVFLAFVIGPQLARRVVMPFEAREVSERSQERPRWATPPHSPLRSGARRARSTYPYREAEALHVTPATQASLRPRRDSGFVVTVVSRLARLDVRGALAEVRGVLGV
ncbi:hypothetical protein M427DRAFT_67427 [Gonapodya prolifera JEL478]|uniref:Uncharacterized protein n=1 Tax=Gonapodya prolifera (strain JEL478) TaxID=1344416 RepID=A0A139AQ61_GONPJ|nr:hypothetical protein M427DRAFT_67427 [Gonapodya prolifera JEL478]|eukprot:KXS18794.1 hypothetical protein M427DRAFT_67427 [Gonapodya prolifera JEL478]